VMASLPPVERHREELDIIYRVKGLCVINANYQQTMRRVNLFDITSCTTHLKVQ